MEDWERKSSKPLRYAKVSHEERVKLVRLINEEAFSIGKAAKALSIKLSTAKLIWRRFRTNGTYFQKMSDRQARLARLAAQQNSSEKEQSFDLGEENIKQNAPEISLVIEPAIQTTQSKVVGNEAYTIRSDFDGRLDFYWWGYACFVSLSPNWGHSY